MLTQLDLPSNSIGDEGARHLAQALQQNTVTLQIVFHLNQKSLLYLSVDTYAIQPVI